MTLQLSQHFRFDSSGSSPIRKFVTFGLAAAFLCTGMALQARADTRPVEVLDPNLQLTTAVTGGLASRSAWCSCRGAIR